MLQQIKSVLIGVTEEGDDQEVSSALRYGISLAQDAGAHATIQAAAVKLVLTHAFVSDFAAGLVATENQRLQTLAQAAADKARRDAEAAGVICTSEAPNLPIRIWSDRSRRKRMSMTSRFSTRSLWRSRSIAASSSTCCSRVAVR
jgi:hypothetical protein